MRRPTAALRPVALWWARLRLRRRPLAWWAVVVALALAAGAVVSTALEAARADGRRYGPPTPVVVARRDLPPGTAVGPGAVALTTWPGALVPADALSELPPGRTVTQLVLAGEPLVERRLGDARLARGTRALAVPTGPGRLPVQPGERVDVLATFDPLVRPRGTPATTTVTRAATVLAVRPDAITVAVPEAEAPEVAFALSQASITLALAPPPGTVAARDRSGAAQRAQQ